VFQLQANVQRAAVMPHGLVKGQARTGALFPQDPRFMGQLFHGGLAALGQMMLGRTKHHQLVFHPGLHLDVRVAAVAFN